MIRIGITGQTGFIGKNLFNQLALYQEIIERIPFENVFFQNGRALSHFVKQCNVIVHLAAVSRDEDQQRLYDTNIALVTKLVEAMETEHVRPYVFFASSIQEELNNLYGKSKRDGREILEKWAKRNDASFSGLILPNVFGPFARPGYSSFVATFCYKLTHDECPVILQDNQIKLVYIDSVCQYIISKIIKRKQSTVSVIEKDSVPFDFEKKVSDVLKLLEYYKRSYYDKGLLPVLKDRYEFNLFVTFSCYIDLTSYFPMMLPKHTNSNGCFVEIIKSGIGGEVSFSIILPEMTYGNHYHTRKIERIAVIKGKALIQLRRIGSNSILKFELYGQIPAYVDIPIWYTYSITNIGEEELYTQFYISECNNPDDGDTFFEIV